MFSSLLRFLTSRRGDVNSSAPGEVTMARRVVFTIISLLLATCAFYNADPTPDVNLFGVLFLFFAFIVWFCWNDIQAGYAYLEDAGVPRYETSGLMFLRFAPMYLRELTAKKRRRPEPRRLDTPSLDSSLRPPYILPP